MELPAQRKRDQGKKSVSGNSLQSSATTQAVRKLAQISYEPSRAARGSSRSVNYLSSTTASRAKAASAVQIHRPTTIASVNQIVMNAVAKTEGRPKSANNNKDQLGETSNMTLANAKGKSKSQATLKSFSATGRQLLLSMDKPAGAVATSSGGGSSSQETTSHKSRHSRRKTTVHVTMNKTSELRAALHKRSSTAKSESGRTFVSTSYGGKGKGSKSKLGSSSGTSRLSRRRSHKRPSTAAPASLKPVSIISPPPVIPT